MQSAKRPGFAPLSAVSKPVVRPVVPVAATAEEKQVSVEGASLDDGLEACLGCDLTLEEALSSADDVIAQFEEAPSRALTATTAAPPTLPTAVTAAKPPPARQPLPLLAPARKPVFAAPASKVSAPKIPAASAVPGKKAASSAQAPKPAGAAAPDAAPLVPRAPTAYMLFSQERRPILKAEQPALSFGELAKAVGAEWGALEACAKVPYTEAAERSKASLLALHGPQPPTKRKAAADGEGGKAKKAKKEVDPNAPLKPKTFSAWAVFCAERRPLLKAESPQLTFGEVSKAVGAEWNALEAGLKAQYAARAAQLTADAPPRLPAAPKAACAKVVKAPKAGKPPKAAKAPAESESAQRESDAGDGDAPEGASLSEGDDGDAMEEDGEDGEQLRAWGAPVSSARAAPVGGDEDDEGEGEAAWGDDRATPVSFLLSRLRGGAFVAVRAPDAVPTAEPPLCSLISREQQALHDPDAPDLLHSEAQEQELAIAAAAFKAALAQRSDRGGVDLGDLEADSPLRSMLLLELLRAKGGPLHHAALGKGKKNGLGINDALIKVPAIALSFLVERMVRGAVEEERRRTSPKAPPMREAEAMETDKAMWTEQPALAPVGLMEQREE